MPRKDDRNHAYRNDDVHAIPATILLAIVLALVIIGAILAIQEINFWFDQLTAALVPDQCASCVVRSLY